MIHSCYRYSCIALLSLIASILVGVFCHRAYSAEFSRTTAQDAVTASRRTAIVTAVENASPAVANISAVREQRTSSDDWFWGEIPIDASGVHFEKSVPGLLLTKMDTSSQTITSLQAQT